MNVNLHAGDGVDQGQCIRACCLCRFRHFRNVCHIGAQLHDDGLFCMFFQFGSNVIQGIRFLSEGNGSFLDIRAGYIDLQHADCRLVSQTFHHVHIILHGLAADIYDDLRVIFFQERNVSLHEHINAGIL